MAWVAMAFLLFMLPAYGQRQCGSDNYNKDRNASAHVQQYNKQSLQGQTIRIPVVFHVVYNKARQNLSSRQIHSQLKVLNEDFNRNNADTVNTPTVFKDVAANCNIRFCLATKNPEGKTSDGITRTYTHHQEFGLQDSIKFDSLGGKSGWPSEQYLNIWIGNLRAGLSGYASNPGHETVTDGVVLHYKRVGRLGIVEAPYQGGRTATHEIGHWLGLEHHWGAVCKDADNLEDTPIQKDPNFGCPEFPKPNCENTSGGQMFMNYMDYTVDHCMNMFTQDQKIHIHEILKSKRKQLFQNSEKQESVCNIAIPKKQVKLYPNPANNHIALDFSAFSEIRVFKLILFDQNGRKILYQSFSIKKKKKKRVNLNGLPAGSYYLNVRNNFINETKKVLIY